MCSVFLIADENDDPSIQRNVLFNVHQPFISHQSALHDLYPPFNTNRFSTDTMSPCFHREPMGFPVLIGRYTHDVFICVFL